MSYEQLSPREKAAVDLSALQSLMNVEIPRNLRDMTNPTDEQLAAVYIADMLDGRSPRVELTEGATALITQSLQHARENTSLATARGLESELDDALSEYRRLTPDRVTAIADQLAALAPQHTQTRYPQRIEQTNRWVIGSEGELVQPTGGGATIPVDMNRALNQYRTEGTAGMGGSAATIPTPQRTDQIERE